jgi:hypothetical protein
VFNESQDLTGDSIPATIVDNTLYAIDPFDLYYDPYGPPFAIASNNVFLPDPGPALNTAFGFDVPEPAGVSVLLFASLAGATVRTASVAATWRTRAPACSDPGLPPEPQIQSASDPPGLDRVEVGQSRWVRL